MNIQLMTDSGADIPDQLGEKINLQIVPLYLHFKDGEYKSGVDIDLSTFHQKIKDTGELPRSAAPSPNDFYEAFKKVDKNKPIIMLSLSKGLSSTYENAVAGKNMLLEDEPGRKIEVLNTKTASCGIGLLLHEANQKMLEKKSFDHLVSHLSRKIEKTVSLFVLKTLENLIIGGRLDRMRGAIAKTLNIKVLLKGSEKGTIEITEKVRGEKRSIRRFIEQIGEYTKQAEDKIIAMTHCNDEARAKSVLAEIREKYPFKDAYLSETGPLISTYGGSGAIVISFFRD